MLSSIFLRKMPDMEDLQNSFSMEMKVRRPRSRSCLIPGANFSQCEAFENLNEEFSQGTAFSRRIESLH
jgi:hypothetical protein